MRGFCVQPIAEIVRRHRTGTVLQVSEAEWAGLLAGEIVIVPLNDIMPGETRFWVFRPSSNQGMAVEIRHQHAFGVALQAAEGDE